LIRKLRVLGNNNLLKYFKRAKLFLFFLLLSLSYTTSISQINDPFGNPFIKNFSKKQIKKDLKIFDISQNKNGEIYFATAGSLMEFDGFRWINYSSKEESDLRAVLYIDDQHIYTAGHGGFGYWSKNSKGILEYSSLFFKYPTKMASLLPVFSNIVEIEGKILFQSFQQIYSYNPSDTKFNIITANKGFSALFSSNNRAFVQDVSIGLFEIINTEKRIVKGTEKTTLDIAELFLELDNSLLIASKNNGFWSVKDGVLLKKQWKINKEAENFIITDVKKYIDGKFIVGTLRNGFYIISNEGKKLAHFNKNNGIENNAIRNLFKDSNNNIWLGTESGISYVEVNSETKYLLDTKSNFGTVYTSYLNDSILYLGTNQGLFFKNINKPNSEPKLIDKNTEHIWEIDKIGDQILVGSNKGVSLLENNSLKTIHQEGGGWVFKKHPKINNLLYVGFYSGIAVFQKKNKQWKFLKKFDGFGESSRFIEFDQYGQIWVAHPSKGYYRLTLSKNGLDLKDVEFYGVENPNIEPYAYICKIDENLVFYNQKGFFYYDAIDNSFTTAKYPTEIFKGLKNINYIYQDENVFWYSTSNLLGYVLRDGNHFNKYQEPFYTVWDKHLKDFNKVEKINNSSYAVGIDNGLIFHSISSKRRKPLKNAPIIKLIEFISATDTIIASIDTDNELKVPNKNNFLKVKVALPNIPLSNSREFQFKLKGLERAWSPWIYKSEINFPGLTSGNYVLELRTKGELSSDFKVVGIPFYIDYPWYINNTAKAIYIFSFLLVFIGYRTYLKRKSEKYVIQLKQLEKEKRERQKEQFELEKMAADKELFLLKEENLNLEIKKKNSALASSALNNIKKNELLTDLIKDIKGIDEELLNSSLHYPVKKVIKKINNHLIDKEDWLTFQFHFSNSHAQFFQKLREKHPNLSSNEIKLSAYLKLNISSKEIASLMNVAITSVEQSRYRLRKKFNLDKDVNLVNYIQKI
jgi:ligand-binding sensor domain-containing protein/DNA-binding CsgD family transcriptional regulator